MSQYVKGLRDTIRNLRKVNPACGKGCQVALVRSGLIILRRSKKQVPVDLGNLKAGGYMRRLRTGFDTTVQIGYPAEYALPVHEDTTKAHGAEYNRKHAEEIADPNSKVHSRGAQQKAKFLEDPYLEELPKIPRKVTAAVKMQLKKRIKG